MAKTFTDIVNNVAADIGDTTAEMKTIIGIYVNNRQRDIMRATNWEVIDDDYTISVTAATTTYTLPSNFGKELYAVDQTNNREITQRTFDLLRQEYSDSLAETGTVIHYTVFRDDSNVKKVKFFRTPSANITVLFPYKIGVPTDLSGTDVPINEFADLLETGAKADAWRYKRQFNKAAVFDVLWDSQLDMYMWNEENQENDGHWFSVDQDQYDRNNVG
jgi:hypothetical protein